MKLQKILHLHILGTGAEYIWEELEKISDVSKNNTIEELVYDLPNTTDEESIKTSGRRINWEPLYGELSQGEYGITLLGNSSPIININFTIDENGNVSYGESTIE